MWGLVRREEDIGEEKRERRGQRRGEEEIRLDRETVDTNEDWGEEMLMMMMMMMMMMIIIIIIMLIEKLSDESTKFVIIITIKLT